MRSKLQKRIVTGAQKTIDRLKTKFESSEHAEALKATNFQIPPPYAKKDIVVQLKEINGKLNLD